MQLIVDRFEGDYMIVEYTDQERKQRFAKLERVLLPEAKEGDVAELSVSREATQERAKRISRLMDELFE